MSAAWSVEQVASVAPSASAMSAAQSLATPTRWSQLGADRTGVWGSFQGSGAEPYDTMVDHARLGFSCSCPSRQTPCKHALALLLLWVRGQIADTVAPSHIEAWMQRRGAASSRAAAAADNEAGELSGGGNATGKPDATDGSGATLDGAVIGDEQPAPPAPPPDPDRNTARDDRVARMHAGLAELDRWLDDRIRTGLADPSLARYATWDQLAARLVDAQAGSLANRVRRLAGLVGASPDWHDDVLAELGMLHLLAQAGRRIGALPGSLADAVATSVGWQVRQADVIAGVPDTDEWLIAGRSDVREDRIEVRRHWLRGVNSGRWALALSFAAYQQSLDTSLPVGSSLRADLHRYPGPALRALVGTRYYDPVDHPSVVSQFAASACSIADGCAEVGVMVAAEPWLDRVPVTVHARLARAGQAWALADSTGSMPILDLGTRAFDAGVAMLLAVSGGKPVDLTVEWTPHGVVPLSIHLPDRTVDIGPRANTSFVSAA
ncbi:SWIM zinc finger family protein [uncultured Ilumatobacter sp.]|uniref:SWIM zinc finger family protein n=1 Tax=uncultured Ilumatobacter sp. TaxID=879968 RepID=UPI00374E5547